MSRSNISESGVGVNVDLEHLSQQRVMESVSSIVGYIKRKRELIVAQL
jgi:hypothetical protein